jgi:hypothetical protein
LEAAEGTQRWILEDRRSERFVRLGDEDAELVGLLVGRRTLEQLMAEATRRLGPVGPARLTLLLASLGERGFPLVERDGYHILVDLLREPGLRQRAREELRRRIAGGDAAASPVVARYALFGLVWSAFGALLGIAVSLRYEPAIAAFAPAPVVWPAMGVVWLALLVPVLAAIGPPALERLRTRRA